MIQHSILLVQKVQNIFEFSVNSTQTISGQFSTSPGETITVEWGDGGSDDYTGIDQNWSKDYGSAVNQTVTIHNASALTKFQMDEGGADISFDLSDLPSGLTYFGCTGSNTVSGDIADLPSGLTSLTCSGSNTISGDIADLPSGLTSFSCSGSNTISGNLADLPSGLTNFTCLGSNTISDYTGKTWTTRPTTFNLRGNAALSTAEVDQLLIDFDDDLTWDSGSINITGSCEGRSATSDAAVTSITGEGASVTTN